MRTLAVIASILTAFFLAESGRHAAGKLAGLIAAGLWISAPLVLENTVYAIPDPWIYLMTAFALWSAITAIGAREPGRPYRALWSVSAGLIACLLKYPAAPALLPGVIAALIIWRRDRGLGTRILVGQAVLGLAVGAFLLGVYRADQLINIEADAARKQGLSGLLQLVLDPARVWNNFAFACLPLPGVLVLGLLVGGVGGYVASWRLKPFNIQRIPIRPVLLVIPVFLLFPWVASAFSPGTIQRLRDVLPATVALCLIAGIAAQQFAFLVLALPAQTFRRLALVGATALVILALWPSVLGTAALISDRRRPDWRVEIRTWSDQSLPVGTVWVSYENHKTFNPFWGGVPYKHWFDWIWEQHNLMDFPPQQWRTGEGLSYAAVLVDNVKAMQATEAGRAYLAQLLPLRTFPDDGSHRGPATAFYRFWRMQHAAEADFGGQIRLVGYDADPTSETLAPGSKLTLGFYWQPLRPVSVNYSVFVHFTRLDTRDVLTQADGPPALARPTSTWNDTGETLIGSPFAITVPPDLKPGTYRVFVGVYDSSTGQRLPLASQADALELMQVRIAAPSSNG
jgi:hypothetical protein